MIMFDIFKKIAVAVVTGVTVSTVFCSTVLAAPKTMPDGNQFDADYYRANNPDVVIVLGPDEEVLYNHYLTFGKAEGRAPYDNTPSVDPNAQSVDPNAQAVLNLVNIARGEQGLSGLTLDSTLTECALVRAREINATGCFSHTRPDGTKCFTAFSQCGISYRYAGENIAYGFANANDVMQGWMNSPGHRSNILNSNFGKLGVAKVGIYWVQLFTN